MLLGSETRRDGGPWVFVKQDKSYLLCAACHPGIAAVAQSASSGSLKDVALGMPSGSVTAKRPGHCDYCDSELGEKSYGLDLLANRRETIARVNKHPGAVMRQRLCISCGRWWIATMRDPSLLTGASLRRLEGPPGGWLGERVLDAVAPFLARHDLATLEQTLAAMGSKIRPLQALAEEGEFAIFVRAGRRDRAGHLVDSLGKRTRQSIVVASADSLDDAKQALLAGAADLLAEPLTPNQIAGALDRLGTGWTRSRSSATGLPVLDESLPVMKYGLPAADLDFDGDAKLTVASYLSVRRFLRGFDYVGIRHGRVGARVYANPRDLPRIEDRLSEVLGVEVAVRPVVQVEAREEQAA